MAREFPTVPFERYADDVVVHCKSERQARFVLGEITKRMADCHLELNQDKTRIVYCKDSNRKGSHEHERFDFLGYTFRPRRARNGRGELFVSFSPAVSDDAAKSDTSNDPDDGGFTYGAGHPLRTSHGRQTRSCEDGSTTTGSFYPTELAKSLRRIDEYLVRWAMRKYKRLQRPPQAGLGVLGGRGSTRTRALCSLASGTHPTTGWWEPYDGRLSRTVLREPGLQCPGPLTKHHKRANRKRGGRK